VQPFDLLIDPMAGGGTTIDGYHRLIAHRIE
jgi:hypothetical protein